MTVEKHSLGDDVEAVAKELMHVISGQGTGELSQKFGHLVEHAASEAMSSLQDLREHLLSGGDSLYDGASAPAMGGAHGFGSIPTGGFTPQSGFSSHFGGAAGSTYSFGHGSAPHGAGSTGGHSGSAHAGSRPPFEQATGTTGHGSQGAHGFGGTPGGIPGGYKPQHEYTAAGGPADNGHSEPPPFGKYSAGSDGHGSYEGGVPENDFKPDQEDSADNDTGTDGASSAQHTEERPDTEAARERLDDHGNFYRSLNLSPLRDKNGTIGLMNKETGEFKELSNRDIKKAYMTAVKSSHPDNGGTQEKFAAVSNAYEALKEPSMRGAYNDGLQAFKAAVTGKQAADSQTFAQESSDIAATEAKVKARKEEGDRISKQDL